MKAVSAKATGAPILQLLTQGITPEKIALSLAFGIMLGVFPVPDARAWPTPICCILSACSG
jgi:hypothetical protein